VRAAILSRRFWFESAPLILLCLLPVVIYLPSLGAPFERDEGVYATIAQGVLDGRVPYRDLFDNKPPLVFGWYAFSFLLFGEDVIAPRIIAAAALSLTTLSIFAQARMMFPRSVAYLAAGLFALSTGLPFVSLHANTEVYMLLPLVTSLVPFTIGMRTGKLRWFLLAGALGGLAVMTKQVAIWNLLLLAVLPTVWRWDPAPPLSRRLAPAACLLAGAFATVGLVAVPFAAAGALDDLVYANLSYNWLYMGFLTYGQRLLNMFQGVSYFLLVAAPLIVGALLGFVMLIKRRRGAADYIVLLWALGSLAGVASGGRFFPHYFLHLLPAMALLTALAIYEGVRRRPVSLVPKRVLVPALALVAFTLAANLVLHVAPAPAEERVAENVFQQKQWESSSKALAQYIAERTSPDDTIFNFGRESQIYFYADRRPAVPYFYDWAYWYDVETLPETVEALRQAKPVYVIDSAQAPLFKDYPRYHPPEFRAFLDESYEYIGRIYFADVYRIKRTPLKLDLPVAQDNPLEQPYRREQRY